MQNTDFYIKRNDVLPAISGVLYTGSTVIDLTGATVKFLMMDGVDTMVISAAAVIVDAVGGQVLYEWDPADTQIAGIYRAEWEITFPDTSKMTVPNDGYNQIEILPDVDDA